MGLGCEYATHRMLEPTEECGIKNSLGDVTLVIITSPSGSVPSSLSSHPLMMSTQYPSPGLVYVLELSGQPSPNADPIIPPACIAMADKSNKFLTAFHCLQQDERVKTQND